MVLKINLPVFFRIFLLISFFSWSHLTFAQVRCGTVEHTQYLRDQGKIKQTDEQFEEWLSKRMRERQQQLRTMRTHGGPYQIPVVVHIIHNGEVIGTGANIPEAQVLSQMDVINKDFKRLNADATQTPTEFQSVAGSMDIEFVLAKRDPSGQPTTGVVRINGGKASWTTGEEDDFKALSYWPSEDYLNIWVLRFSGTFIGFAQFPVSNLPGLEDYTDGIAETDGIMIDHRAFGSIDDGAFNLYSNYNKGRTVTHELGHFFGLRHIWGDQGNCTATDYVSDTPTQESSYNGQCPLPNVRTSCSSSDMYMNYLDYTNDACMNIFTQGQISRMELIINDTQVPRRNSLLSSPGLLDPNCTFADLALTRIESPGPVTCNSQPTLKVVVRNTGCVEINSLKTSYTTNGSAPVIGTLILEPPLALSEIRTLALADLVLQEGINDLSFSIIEINGSADEVPDNSTLLFNVGVVKTYERIPLRERFDTFSWSAINQQNGINWQLINTNFGGSATVQAYNSPEPGEIAWLVSPVLDFSMTNKASMFFDLSYAWAPDKNDQLRILASTDCGDTYTTSLFNKSGESLSNLKTTSPWIPSTENQWQLRNFIDLSAFAGEQTVRIAFVFTNASGNNLYLDNIEFYLSDDQTPVDIGDDLYSVYWYNRYPYRASVTFNLPERMPVGIEVLDMTGRSCFQTTANDVLNQTFPLELQDQAAGIYILRVRISNRYYSTKYFLSR